MGPLGFLHPVCRVATPAVAALATHGEPDSIPNEQAPVRACQRTIAHRPGQFAYVAAIAAHRPMGSGEVESAHRHVIQKRLELPGACGQPTMPKPCRICAPCVPTTAGMTIGTSAMLLDLLHTRSGSVV